jgi:HD-like signal output (HDOD) protein
MAAPGLPWVRASPAALGDPIVLNRPLPDLAAWTRFLSSREIPVQRVTAEALTALREDEDAVDAGSIASIVLDDPLMTLRVLAHLARHRSSRLVTEVETVTAAVLMIGVPPFLRTFEGMMVIEDVLEQYPAALDGLEGVLRRARRASRFALGFAVLRKDSDAAVIHEAALLHDFAEMLVWCHAPALALQILQLQRDDPTLRTARVQRDVLGVEVCDLEQALMKAWRLPELLVTMTDDRHGEAPRVRNVLLAIALARHSQCGWDNPALPDDYEAIGRLLNVSADAAHHRVLALNID